MELTGAYSKLGGSGDRHPEALSQTHGQNTRFQLAEGQVTPTMSVTRDGHLSPWLYPAFPGRAGCPLPAQIGGEDSLVFPSLRALLRLELKILTSWTSVKDGGDGEPLRQAAAFLLFF